MDILAMQEVRWKGYGELNEQNYTFLYSGNTEKQGNKGTGFMNKIKNSLLGFEPINERLCKFRIKGKFANLTCVCLRSDRKR